MPILAVDSKGNVTAEAVSNYTLIRRDAVARKIQACFESGPVARGWFDALSEKDLYEEKDGETKYMGETSAEEDTKAALERAKGTADPIEMVGAIEDLILYFCGFNAMKPLKAVCIVNAVHFQFDVDVERLLDFQFSLPSAEDAPTENEKAFFDNAVVSSGELLLRCIVETGDGGFLANPFSPGMPMGKLLKLPLFAQFVMVLTNAVEAVWYNEAVPTCPMAINLYASLLVDNAPVLQMIDGVHVVEVMEMTKGARRGPQVDDWVGKIREAGAIVLLDDFDANHPAVDSKPDGIKVSVFANAFHSLQAFKNQPLGDASRPFLPITEIPFVEKEKANPCDLVDYYGSIVLKHQRGVNILVMEGSENCLKSEVPGPPLNFSEPKATVASAHVYQAAARVMRANQAGSQSFRMLHQGGRALYPDEDFDQDACAVIAASGKPIASARTGDAGTIAWIGQEAVRRAAMQVRPLVCGLIRK